MQVQKDRRGGLEWVSASLTFYDSILLNGEKGEEKEEMAEEKEKVESRWVRFCSRGEGGKMRKAVTIKRKPPQICRKYSSQSYKYL